MPNRFQKGHFTSLKEQNQFFLAQLPHLEWNWFLPKHDIWVHGAYQLHTSFQNLKVHVITIEPKYVWLSKTTFKTIPPTIITWNKNTNRCFRWYDFHIALKVGVLLQNIALSELDLGVQCSICHTPCSQVISQISPPMHMKTRIP